MDLKRLRRYRAGQSLDVRAVGSDVVVTFSAERDDFDAVDDGRGWLSSLVGLRAEIANGDERALYLAWLLGVQYGEVDERAVEPARPDHLETLSPPLETFVDVVGLDRDLVAAAAEGASQGSAAPRAKELDRWIAGLDEPERVGLLSRVARGEMGIGNELMRRFRRQTSRSASREELRTAGALCARAQEFAGQRQRLIAAREAKESARHARELAAARERHLRALEKRQIEAWRRVEALVVTKRPADYDAAITLLKDLQEIGKRKGRSADVAERIRALREAHAKKPSFLARLRKAGF